MKLSERYADLTQDLTLFGKTYPALFKELTIDNLQSYANNCIASKYPALHSIGLEVNRNLCISNYNLDGNI